jgi:hypothetical protein
MLKDVSYTLATLAIWWCNKFSVYVNFNVTATAQHTMYQRSEYINYALVEAWNSAQCLSQFKMDLQVPKSQFCLTHFFQYITVNITMSIFIVHFIFIWLCNFIFNK